VLKISHECSTPFDNHPAGHGAVVDAGKLEADGPFEQQVDDRLVEAVAMARLAEPVRAEVAEELGTLGSHAFAFQGAQQPKVEHVASVAARAVDQLDVGADHRHLLQLFGWEGQELQGLQVG